jgi:hypothetical protein
MACATHTKRIDLGGGGRNLSRPTASFGCGPPPTQNKIKPIARV